MRSMLMHAVVLGLVTLSQGGIVETIRERAQAHGVSGSSMVSLATCESHLDPNAVGDRGNSVGLFQIHDRGLLPTFLAWGYTDRSDPWQSADFAARAISQGMAHHWTCWRR